MRRDVGDLLSAGDRLSSGNHLGGSAEPGPLYFLPATLDGDGLPDVCLLRHNVRRAGHFLCFGMYFSCVERYVWMQFLRRAATGGVGIGERPLLSGRVEFGFSGRRHAEPTVRAGCPDCRQSGAQDIREADSAESGIGAATATATKTSFDAEADPGEQHAKHSGDAGADRPQ